MKKLLRPLFFTLLLLALASSAPAAVPLLGDLNNDGRTDLADTIGLLQLLSGADTTGGTISINNADIDLDGRLGLNEAIFILQATAGLRESGVSTQDAAGTVVLPPGFALAMTGLIVQGKMGSAAVDADGLFTLPLSGTGDALVVVTDAEGTPLMLGYMAGSSAGNAIGAQSTAVALLFQALGAYTQPLSTWAQIRSLIGATDQAATLAGVIAERLAADPLALSKGDPAIAAALSAAVEAIAAQRSQTSLRSTLSAGTSVSVTVTRSPLSADLTHVKVDGINPRSGVYIEPAADGNGIIARNDYRRHVLVLVYRTGWEGTDGIRHDTAWELAAQGPFEPLASGAYLMATTAVGGVIPSLVDLMFGNVVYSPTTTSLIPLPMFPGVSPDLIAKTFYQVVAAGDGLEADPVPPAALASVAAAVQTAQSTMRALEFFKEFFLPVLFAVIPSDELASQNNLSKEYVAAALDIINLVSQGSSDVATYYAAGQYSNAAIAALKALVNNPTLLTKVGTRIAKAGIVKGWNAATNGALSGVAQKALVLLAIADKVVTAFDALVLFVHLANSQAYTLWDATVLWPAVRVQPDPATVEAMGTVPLLVTVGGETGNSDNYYYRFTWTTAGEHGKIVNPAGTAPAGTEVVMTSRSPGARINYESALDAEAGDSDTVRVVVHRVGANGTAAKLGDDETTVTVSGSSVTLAPSTANVDPAGSQVFTATVKPDPDESQGDVYHYQWTNSARYGDLAGGQNSFESTTAATVTYVARDQEGVDCISLSVYRERGGVRELLGMASAMVNVRNPYALQLTPQGQKLNPGGVQVYTATLVPEMTGELVYSWSNTATRGTLTGDGGTDNFEQSGNQAAYTAGASYGADTIHVKAERLVGGERFDVAEASANVIIGNFTVTLPEKYTVSRGAKILLTATVSAIPTGGYFKWTRTGTRGQLIDYGTSAKTDNYTTSWWKAYFQANSTTNAGYDTVTVGLYVDVNGTPVLLASDECRVLAPVQVGTTIRSATAESAGGCGTSYDYPNYRMYGMVSLAWQPPADFTPSGYSISIDTKGNDLGTSGRGYIQPFYDHTNGFTCTESACNESYCTVLGGTIPIGSVGYRIDWTSATYNDYYKDTYGSKGEYFAYRVQDMNESAAVAGTWTIEVWANP